MDNGSLKEIFQHDLNAIYSTERAVLRELDVMISDVKDSKLRESFQSHKQQTEGQIQRLEKVIRAIGAQPKQVPVPAFEGLVSEKKQAMQQAPREGVDIINLGAGTKVEHLEIAAYESLLDIAKQLGMEKEAAPLKENLQEEQATLQKLKGFGPQAFMAGSQRSAGASQQRNV